MEEDSGSEPPNQQNGIDGPGLGRGFKRERGLSKALSVLRASTKLQPQRRGSSSHLRIVEEDDGLDAEEDSTSVDDSARRRTGSGAAPLQRTQSRQRAANAVAPVEAQRRNAPRGEWSPAEEAVLARKHMELGNKWTTISHFLPARSDNDVKNIWHSTLRSKNSERRSFLRTYARAVRDCANDAEARKQAYEMAQRVCGPPQPIEQALAAVQQQYQQQLQLQASMADEVLAEGDSPEYMPPDVNDRDATAAPLDGRERETEPPAAPAQAPAGAQFRLHQQSAPESGPVEPHRSSGTCSRTSSAPDSSQQHQHQQPQPQPQSNGARGAYGRGPVCGTPDVPAAGPSASPLEALDAAAAAGGGFLAYPPHMPARGSLTLNRDSSQSLGLSATTGHQLLSPQQQQQVGEDGAQPQSRVQAQTIHTGPTQATSSSRSGAEVDTSCLARFSALQLADQRLQRQQQQQMLQRQQMQQVWQQQQQQAGAYGAGGMSCSGAAPEAAGPGGGSGGLPSGVDFDDVLALGLDLTAEDMEMLGQGPAGNQQQQMQPGGQGGAAAAAGREAGVHAAALPVSCAAQHQRVPSLEQQQQQQRMMAMMMRDSLQQQQQRQPGSAVLEHQLSGNGRPRGAPSGSAALAAGERPPMPMHQPMPMQPPPPPTQQHQQQQPDAFDSLLAELEHRSRLRMLATQPHPPPHPQHAQHSNYPQPHSLQPPHPLHYQHLGGSLSLQLPEQHHQGQHQHPNQQYPGQGQDDVLGLQLGSPYAYRCYPPGAASLDPQALLAAGCGGGGGGGGASSSLRCGFIAPHNTIAELQSLASCSSTIELINSGQHGSIDGSKPPAHLLSQQAQQHHMGQGQGQQVSTLARRGSALGMFGTSGLPLAANESFSNASSGLLSPLGTGSGHATLTGHQRPAPGGPQVYPLAGGAAAAASGGSGVWHASACGANDGATAGGGGGGAGGGGWAAGMVRQGGGVAGRTLSSPVAFCGDAAGGSDAAAAAAAAGLAGGGGGAAAGGGSGLVGGGRGSGLIEPSMSSLAVPAQVDVVTMGLDSGDLLDCMMDCAMEGEAGEAEGGSGILVMEESMDLALRASARAVVMQQQQNMQQQQSNMQQRQQQMQMQQQQQMAGGRGLMLQGQSAGGGGGAAAQAFWPAGKPQSFNEGRIGPMLRL